ncbi:MAG: class I SAM-dependent methyltransferase [Gammaproteobacteria bacterium]|nr:class I SAM-dependent methyltransferase [Gammaproteobacteria bacterium]
MTQARHTPTGAPIDALRADIEFATELRGRRFEFATTWGLFSPRAIDAGSQLLIRHLHIDTQDDCLDLGCGYGAIGLSMASLAPQGHTLMVDKDFVAVHYANRNAARNGITNAEALLSNGLAGIPAGRSDVIATNLPAKSGKELYQIMFYDVARRLRPGGRFYVVSLSGLRRFVARELQTAFGNCEKLKTSGQYTLALARKE